MSRTRVNELLAEHPAPDQPGGYPPGGVPATDHFPLPRVGPAGYRLWDSKAIESWALMDPDERLRGEMAKLPPMGRAAPQLERVLALASEQARELNHLVIGTEHLVLGVAHPESPGAGRTALESFGLGFVRLQSVLEEFFGDSFEPHDRVLRIAPAAKLALARANLAAADLQDEIASSEHLLLALGGDRPAHQWSLIPLHLAGRPLYERVLAATEGVTTFPESSLSEPSQTGSSGSRGDLSLARSPLGHDPYRRGPWGSVLFRDHNGELSEPGGNSPRQYFIDRDGYPVLTTDGRPVHTVDHSDGTPLLDARNVPELAAVPIPSNSRVVPRVARA